MMKVAIIGGGAAGLVAAIAAAREGANVTIYEADKRVGQKILKTGNGRCNLTNANVQPTDYREPFYIAPLIEAYPSDRVLEFFDELGLLTVEEEDGRVYPFSNSANTVLEVLRNGCARLGVETLCERTVSSVHATKGGFDINCRNGETHHADRIIVATGGGTDLLACLGHEIVPYQPVLCPLKTDTAPLRGLSGVRAHAKVSAYESLEAYEPYAWLFGEVLFRDYGLSGIVIFDMSREVDEGDYLSLDFIPQVSEEECASWLISKYKRMCMHADVHNTGMPSYSELMSGVFHKRLNEAILRMARIKPSSGIEKDRLVEVVRTAKNFKVRVTGLGNASKAQVTRGGAAIDEFDALTLESKLCPGAYAAGETLSVDGRCGGFNLHWAWASGIAAGSAAAGK